MKRSWLVVDDGLRVSRDGLDLQLRLPWYRGLPISTVDIGEVRIDGETIDESEISISINGKDRPASDLAQYYEEYWYVLDSAYLHVPYAKAKKGYTYEVDVTVVLYPPYIPGIPFRTNYKEVLHAN